MFWQMKLRTTTKKNRTKRIKVYCKMMGGGGQQKSTQISEKEFFGNIFGYFCTGRLQHKISQRIREISDKRICLSFSIHNLEFQVQQVNIFHIEKAYKTHNMSDPLILRAVRCKVMC